MPFQDVACRCSDSKRPCVHQAENVPCHAKSAFPWQPGHPPAPTAATIGVIAALGIHVNDGKGPATRPFGLPSARVFLRICTIWGSGWLLRGASPAASLGGGPAAGD